MRAKDIGQAGLVGWREKVADSLSGPVVRRTPATEDQMRAVFGALFALLATMYLVKVARQLSRQT